MVDLVDRAAGEAAAVVRVVFARVARPMELVALKGQRDLTEQMARLGETGIWLSSLFQQTFSLRPVLTASIVLS